MSVVATANKAFSYPVVGYGFDVTGCTEDGTTRNVVTCSGIQPDFVVNGIWVVDVATTSDNNTAMAAYAVVDTDDITNNANTAQQVVFGLYVASANGRGTASIVRVFLY